MKAKKIAFTGIPVTDMKRARAFYEGVLGLKLAGEFGEGVWVEYELGPDTIAIGSVGDQWKPSEDGTSVAIEVEDFDAAIKSLKEKNARFAAEGAFQDFRIERSIGHGAASELLQQLDQMQFARCQVRRPPTAASSARCKALVPEFSAMHSAAPQ